MTQPRHNPDSMKPHGQIQSGLHTPPSSEPVAASQSPHILYHSLLQQGKLQADARQAQVVYHLQNLYEQIDNKHLSLRQRALRVLWRWLRAVGSRLHLCKKAVAQGVYLYGPVGAGKTLLLDMCLQSLPPTITRRYHFHAFMRQLHQEMHRIQGQVNPIASIFAQHLPGVRVLLLDEFFVDDSASAMLLARVLQALSDCNIYLLTSSNLAPDDLYANGMYRERFLPAIAHIKRHNQVISLDSGLDYRQAVELAQDQRYVFPGGQPQHAHLQRLFAQYALGASQPTPDNVDTIQINARSIQVLQACPPCLWVDFKHICGVPRCARDYLSCIERYKVWFISQVPQIQPHEEAYALNFISLIDILYDGKIRLYMQAEVPLDRLYPAGRHTQVFQRTLSRLQHMQAEDWPPRA